MGRCLCFSFPLRWWGHLVLTVLFGLPVGKLHIIHGNGSDWVGMRHLLLEGTLLEVPRGYCFYFIFAVSYTHRLDGVGWYLENILYMRGV